MTYAQMLDQKIEDAVKANDSEALEALLKEHFDETPEGSLPYDAALSLKPEFREKLIDPTLEGDILINWANRISRAQRLVSYRLKTLFGFSGTRIVSEGDSWFQYPVLLKDVIDNFNDEKDLAVLSLGGAGDLVEAMAKRREYHKALIETKSPVLLLSGGGNDLLGDGRFTQILLPYHEGANASDLINKPALQAASDKILGFYREILQDVQSNHPNVTVFGHGYDTPFPKADGAHFGKPFAQAGIPLALGREVIEEIVDFFASELGKLGSLFPNYRFIDLKGRVGAHPNSWRDELHPEDTGFKRAAAPMIEAVKSHIAALGSAGANLAAGFEGHALATAAPSSLTVVLDPGHGGTTSLPGASWNNAIGPSGSLEKNWTLDVCLRARAVLQSRGYNVLMTRDSDVSISGEDRRKVARDARADCFLSVHFNASDRHNAQGTETYVHPTTTSAASIAFMRSVQGAMVAALGHRDRNASRTNDGILRGSYMVIRESRHASKTAVCLHEVSFMDRVDEENRIKQASYRDRIATALADGVEAYFQGGVNAAQSFEFAQEHDYDDAIHEAAAQRGLSVPQYLGAAEAPMAALQHHAPAVLSSPALVDGSMLTQEVQFESHGAGSVLEAMFADAAGLAGGEGDDSGEDAFIDASQGIDFSAFGQDPVQDRLIFNEAYAGFENTGFEYAAFASFVDGLNLRYFTATELLYMGSGNANGSCQGKNAPPPKNLWSNIAHTAQMLDEIRHRIGHPVRILSGYRSPAYNSCVGGVSNSLHATYNALDWTASGGTVVQWHQIAQAVRSENLGKYQGGIGRYNSSNFIHIDTRGTAADWINP